VRGGISRRTPSGARAVRTLPIFGNVIREISSGTGIDYVSVVMDGRERQPFRFKPPHGPEHGLTFLTEARCASRASSVLREVRRSSMLTVGVAHRQSSMEFSERDVGGSRADLRRSRAAIVDARRT